MNLKEQRLTTDALITAAETRVAIAYTLGDIGKEVAERLCIAYGTVVRHTQNIYTKIGIRHSTNALVAWFLSANYGIELRELSRRLGAGVLLLLFTTYTFNAPDVEMVRRARRTRRIEQIADDSDDERRWLC